MEHCPHEMGSAKGKKPQYFMYFETTASLIILKGNHGGKCGLRSKLWFETWLCYKFVLDPSNRDLVNLAEPLLLYMQMEITKSNFAWLL